MDGCITREEHEEFRKRMEEEHSRQNRRIELLEESVKSIQDLTVCVHELAHDMKQMLEEQKEQGERLDKLEQGPGDTWQRIKAKAMDTAVGLIAGALVMGAAVMVAQYIV